MKIGIVGVGSLGSFFAAKLISNRNQVYLLSNSNNSNLKKIKQDGLILIENEKQIKINLQDDNPGNNSLDLIIILSKSQYTELSCILASKFLRKDGYILSLQNGIGQNIIFEKYFNNIIYGITYQAAKLESDGIVQNTGPGLTILQESPRSIEIEEIFNNSKIETNISKNFDSIQCGKLLVNSSINPITAIFRINNGKILENSFYKFLMKKLSKEGEDVIKSMNINLPYENTYEKCLSVCKSTYHNHTSMYVDIQKKNTTEIDFINGYLISKAKLNHVKTPFNKFVFYTIKCIEKLYKF